MLQQTLRDRGSHESQSDHTDMTICFHSLSPLQAIFRTRYARFRPLSLRFVVVLPFVLDRVDRFTFGTVAIERVERITARDHAVAWPGRAIAERPTNSFS